jgi:ABC-type proline/glycine betaine transport system substrate-binding protein
MKNIIKTLSLITLIFAISCTAQEKKPVEPIKFVNTGIECNQWVTIPAGEFLKGQHRHETMVENDYEIMVTDVTNKQYVKFLNEALAKGSIKVVADSVLGYYPGDPFDGYKHEFEITAGDKIYLYLAEP